MVGAAQAVLGGPYASAPNRVRAAYADCVANYLVAAMTPQERADNEAYLRGTKKMTYGEIEAESDALSARVGGPLTYATLDRLSRTCPGDVPSFKQSFGPGFNGL